jgi:hypothetical protein
MTSKLWSRSDEWKVYAACGGSVDHTVPPTRCGEEAGLPVADVDNVRRICDGCRVRPECARWGAGELEPVDVWVCGRFIPVDKRKARKVREELSRTVDLELMLRGEDV